MLRRQRWIAWLVFASFLLAQPVVWLAEHHESLAADAACTTDEAGTFVGPHHAAGAQVEAPTPASPVDHCVFCHLHRSFGAVRLARAVLLLPPGAGAAAVADASSTPLSVVHPHFDPRGPPVTRS